MGCDARVYLRRQGYSCIADLKWYYLPFNFGWAGVFCFVALGERGVGVVQKGWSREDGFDIQEEMMTITAVMDHSTGCCPTCSIGINSFNPLSSLSYMWRE